MFASLLLIAILVNRDAWRCIALTLIVGVIHFLPYNLILSVPCWYSTCIFMDLIILIIAYRVNKAVCFVGVLLVISHIIAWIFDTHEIIHKPYHTIAPFLEYVQVLCLTLFSQPVLNFIKERVKYICLQLKR